VGSYALRMGAGTMPPPRTSELLAHFAARSWYRIDESAYHDHRPDSVYAHYANEDVGTTFRFELDPRDDRLDRDVLVLRVDSGQPHIAGIDVQREVEALAARFGLHLAWPDRDMHRGPYDRATFARSLRRALVAWRREFVSLRTAGTKYFIATEKLEAMARWNERGSPKIRLYVHPDSKKACTGVVVPDGAVTALPPVDLVIVPARVGELQRIAWGWCHAEDELWWGEDGGINDGSGARR
jgi:hypothetical protein